MADEAKTPAETGDDELTAAFAEYKSGKGGEGEIVKEESAPEHDIQAQSETEIEDKETLDHKESSKLGRKVKGLEAEIATLKAALESKSRSTSTDAMDEDADPEILERLEEKRKLDNYERQLAEKKHKTYMAEYLKTISKLAVGNEDVHDDVFELMSTNPEFDRVAGTNAEAEAAYNYAKAIKVVMASRSGKPAIPVKGASTKPAGPSGAATQAGKRAATLPDLSKDPALKALVDHMLARGDSEESIAKKLAKAS
jgi:hypothetical protein